MTEMSVMSFINRIDQAFRDGDPMVDSKATEPINVAHVRRQIEAISRGGFAAFAASLADESPHGLPRRRRKSLPGRDILLAIASGDR